MKFENFTYDKDADGIVTLTWDMPGRSMNVLSASSIAEFRKAAEAAIADDSVKGVVITSGKSTFGAGADLSELGAEGGLGGGNSVAEVFASVYPLNAFFREMETSGKPFAAAINGTALGGMFEVCLACHYRVAADDAKTQLGLPEAKVGVLPGGGGTQRLPRLIGAQEALMLILEGKSVRPAKAAEMGIIHKALPADQLVAEAKRWIKDEGNPVQPWDQKGYRIPGGGPYSPKGANVFIIGNAMVRKQSNGNYPAQHNILKCVYEGIQVPMDAALRIESRYFADLLCRPESRHMIRSLFLSMQALGKGARRPQGVEPKKTKKLGVLGAGLMGAGIAHVSAQAGIEVVLLDRDQASADKGKDYSAKIFDKLIGRGRANEEKKAQVLSRIHPTTSYDDLKGCDLIIEAVFEDRGIKADVTKMAEAQIAPDVIFGSNTSTLPITGLAEASERPANFIGIHFFSPVERMGLVEIIMGEKTSDAALAKTIDYVQQIRKTPIVVNDSRGFYTSRVVSTFTGEGMRMLAEGISPALIENAGRMSGMPMGPLELSDSVGSDTALKISKAAVKELGPDAIAPDVMKAMEWIVEKNDRVGRKAGKGFYDYDEKGKRKKLWPEVFSYAAKPAPVPLAHELEPQFEDLKKRFLYIQSIETARCWEEGVITDVRDADVGSILGFGYAPYTGGTLSFIDMVGLKNFVAEAERLAKTYGPRFEPPKLLKDMAAKGETFYGRFAPIAA